MGLYEDLPSHLPSDDPDQFLGERYEILWDSNNEYHGEKAIAAAMILTAQDLDNLGKGQAVSKTVPSCFWFKYRVMVDSEGVVWFEEQR